MEYRTVVLGNCDNFSSTLGMTKNAAVEFSCLLTAKILSIVVKRVLFCSCASVSADLLSLKILLALGERQLRGKYRVLSLRLNWSRAVNVLSWFGFECRI